MGVDSNMYLGKGICVYTHKMTNKEYKEFMKLLNILGDYLKDFAYIQDAYVTRSFIFFPLDSEGYKKGWEKYHRHPPICFPSKGGAEKYECDGAKEVMKNGGYADDMDACAIMLGGYELSNEVRNMYVDDYFTYTYPLTSDKIAHLTDLLDHFGLIEYPDEDAEDYENNEGVAGDGVPAHVEEINAKKELALKHIKSELDKYLKNPNYTLPGKWLVYWRS